MQDWSRRIAVLGAAFGVMLGAACSPGGREAVDDSEEGLAFQYREGLMHAISWKVAGLRAMADGEVPADDEAFSEGATDVAALAGMVIDGFIPGSNVPGSRALPEIWENWEDFTRRMEEMQMAADSLVAAARSGGVAGSDSALRSLAQTCGNCHRTYRAPDEE